MTKTLQVTLLYQSRLTKCMINIQTKPNMIKKIKISLEFNWQYLVS